MQHTEITFESLQLPVDLLRALNDLGFEKPSPIQTECIPLILAERDVLGMAQTGSGKTAAFGLPFLCKIDVENRQPQLLVLTPTRELAIQVAEACQQYAKYMPQLSVLALYGGQRYDVQLRALRHGAQIVVGTPGRLLDHLKRGTLKLSNLKGVVLDEADEMLRMGFIDDVETIMGQLPEEHQTALFSATMPEPIRRISRRFMQDPVEVKIQASMKTAPDIEQSYWMTYGMKKNEALVRFLEAEDFDGAIVFVRTKSATLDVAEALEKGGYSCAALNGDMNQILREQTLERLKNGRLDVLIATDVAARGLDVERIDLVVNYDIPMDVESYVHRIGRTGRAGRAGKALLFVENRERRLLQNIERTLKRSLSEVELPTNKQIAERRLSKFAETVSTCLETHDIDVYKTLLEKIYPLHEEGADIYCLAAVLLKIAQQERPLVLPHDEPRVKREIKTARRGEKTMRRDRNEPRSTGRRNNNEMDLYRIEVGRTHGVEVRHIVGAIANEGDISSRFIGNIKLFDQHSTVELPKGMPEELLKHFTNTYILNKQMGMSLVRENIESERRWSSDKRREQPQRERTRGNGHHAGGKARDSKRYSQRPSSGRGSQI